MATKTLTITEDSYNLLATRKLEGESFSQEIKRLFSEKTKKKLSDFAGILNDNEADAVLKAIAMSRELDMDMDKELLKKQGLA